VSHDLSEVAVVTKYISFHPAISEASVTRALYSLLFCLLLPAVVIRIYWRSIREPRYRQDLKQRFGLASVSDTQQALPVWVHAVSAGETIAARELVERLLVEGHQVILSHMTPTGRDRAEQMFGDRIKSVYAPYDIPLFVSWFLARVQPKALIIIDTELWPNMITLCRKKRIPVYLVNGRLSTKSAAGYQRVKLISRQMFESLSEVFAQTETQAQRFSALGAPSVVTTGSIKFDARLPEDFPNRVETLQEKFQNKFVVLGASTHEGEEAALLAAYKRLNDENALLILAPRHTHRVGAVMDLIAKSGFAFQKHSDGGPLKVGTRIYVLDTMGELIYFYGVSKVAFVGGSLVDVGGHNPMEPGGLGKPILMGPYRRNIADIAEQFSDAGALLTVNDADDVYVALEQLSDMPSQREDMSTAALKVMANNRGALDRVCSVILPLMRENKH
jgi:3-deoxy-D-manno-octulosonic-acid transferase